MDCDGGASIALIHRRFPTYLTSYGGRSLDVLSGGDETCLRCRYLVSLRNSTRNMVYGWGWAGGVLHAAVAVASPGPRTRSRTCGLTEGAMPLREAGRAVVWAVLSQEPNRLLEGFGRRGLLPTYLL